jgi:hypothetical protein
VIAGKPKDLTEDQGKATQFYGESKFANENLKTFDTPDKIPSVIDQWLADPTQTGIAGRFMNSIADPVARNYVINSLGFVNGILRQQTGAAIRPEEMPMLMMRYIPVPGDTQEIVAQKAAWREVALNLMETRALGQLPQNPDGTLSLRDVDAMVEQQAAKLSIAPPQGSRAPGAGGAPARRVLREQPDGTWR